MGAAAPQCPNVDQKLLLLSTLQALREEAHDEQQARLNIRVVSLPETGLVGASGEEIMITAASDATARIWEKAAADLSSVTAQDWSQAKALRERLVELRALGRSFENNPAATAAVQDAQEGILVKQLEPMEVKAGGTLSGSPGMVHVASTTLVCGWLCSIFV